MSNEGALVVVAIFGIAAIGLVVAVLLARRRASAADRRAEAAEARAAALEPYAVVPDAQAEATRILSTAQQHAAHLAATANEQAVATRFAADTYSSERRAEADRVLVIAHQEAQRIAGDALKVRDKADDYGRAAAAMKRIIEGYGDEVWIPGTSLLDDLAEQFDYKEAGQRLKQARETTRQLVKESRAAECDYKEKVRRETAIRFVTDAFNGKVDSILSKVKHDNYGKLVAKIDDAFALVNLNGQAFRNARIRFEYLTARKEELVWAVRSMELQRIEREEQREIKEQLREEERARKEYEMAIKSAEKEERMLQRAMLAAQKHLAEAKEAHRAKYQAEIEELQRKLVEAEEKGRRALSMAQQTKRGHVYVISNVGSFGENVFKIGLTRRLEPKDRVRELGDASVPFEFDIHAMIQAEDAPALEAELHRRFVQTQVNKVNSRKEFFRVGVSEIRRVVTEMGIECKWTMAAEAREYRESLAVARGRAEQSSVAPSPARSPSAAREEVVTVAE